MANAKVVYKRTLFGGVSAHSTTPLQKASNRTTITHIIGTYQIMSNKTIVPTPVIDLTGEEAPEVQECQGAMVPPPIMQRMDGIMAPHPLRGGKCPRGIKRRAETQPEEEKSYADDDESDYDEDGPFPGKSHRFKIMFRQVSLMLGRVREIEDSGLTAGLHIGGKIWSATRCRKALEVALDLASEDFDLEVERILSLARYVKRTRPY